MASIILIGPCFPLLAGCWSTPHRCFMARRSQVMNQATDVLGSYRLASEWVSRPALGLDMRTPCSLLADADRYRQVVDHLVRLEYGVY
ncbi:antitoxin Xre/MbcA/ParS toxin-binding domain-containing protein [Pseudomonas alkylphenolica]|uniref:Toxin-antitoxin system antitoxin subunit n=1 Tax=Pseudomonas alkylphenolica TaxID=237609 RepID=A0A077FEG8_9PSED|nr:toxin-antitoxin system antitoxin subunit [Pseudomonas alkylphenolica]